MLVTVTQNHTEVGGDAWGVTESAASPLEGDTSLLPQQAAVCSAECTLNLTCLSCGF